MKKVYFLALIALVAVAFSSCKNDPVFQLSDLQGKWLEDGTEHYLTFLTDKADKEDYMWGYEYDLAQDVTEEDVLDDEHGNGWFMYRLDKAELLEIHKLNQGWADVPKVYTVTVLTAKKLEYHLKDYKNEKISCTKQ